MKNEKQKKILKALKQAHPQAMKNSDLRPLTKLDSGEISNTLNAMLTKGLVMKRMEGNKGCWNLSKVGMSLASTPVNGKPGVAPEKHTPALPKSAADVKLNAALESVSVLAAEREDYRNALLAQLDIAIKVLGSEAVYRHLNRRAADSKLVP